MGAARLHAGDPRRSRGRPGRTERRRQDHAAEPGGRARPSRPRAQSPSSAACRAGSPAALDGIAFVAQDTPLYRNLSGRGHAAPDPQPEPALRPSPTRGAGSPSWASAERRPGKLSGGQRAQLALTLALARRPRLLVLDEPMAMLDPVARHDFMATVLTAMADDGVSVLLSSHVLAELERVADYLDLAVPGPGAGRRRGRRPAGRATGVLTGPAAAGDRLPNGRWCMSAAAGPRPHLLVRAAGGSGRRRAGRRTRSAWRNSPWPTCASPAPRRCPARPAAGLCRLKLANRRR